MNLVSAAERFLRAGERLSQRSGSGQCCATHEKPSRGVGTPGHPPRESNEPTWTKEAGDGGGGVEWGCSAHCGTALRLSRTLEGLPPGSRWSGLDRPSMGGAWPGSAAVSEADLVLGPDLEALKIHSRAPDHLVRFVRFTLLILHQIAEERFGKRPSLEEPISLSSRFQHFPRARLGEPGSSKRESREDQPCGETAHRAAAAAHASPPATPARFHPLSPAPRRPGPMGRARLLGGSRGGGWDRRQRPPLALAHWLRTQGARRPECSEIGCRGSRRWRLLAGAAPVTPGGDWLPGLRGSCLSGSR
ncbi:hypothetical protein LEMLEM_LOCUS18936 [Lemmus lemmus]